MSIYCMYSIIGRVSRGHQRVWAPGMAPLHQFSIDEWKDWEKFTYYYQDLESIHIRKEQLVPIGQECIQLFVKDHGEGGGC